MKDLRDYLHLEEWKDIPNIPFYQASNIGRIRSIDKLVKHNYGGIAVKKGKILSQYINNKGYYSTGITIEGKTKTVSVHTLIALAWHPNPENKPTVNHKDAIKTNNFEWNLEWATNKEQVNHAIANNCRQDFSLSEKTISKIVAKSKKAVSLLDIQSKEIISFNCISDCAGHLNVKQSTISQALRRNSLISKKYVVNYEKKK